MGFVVSLVPKCEGPGAPGAAMVRRRIDEQGLRKGPGKTGKER